MRNILIATLIATLPSLAIAETHNNTMPKARVGESALSNEVQETTLTTLNSLLRGEISAVETYRFAIPKVSDQSGSTVLNRYMANHQAAIDALRGEIVKLNGTPSTTSGVWGAWATTVQGTANLLGDTAALKALKEGEKHGLEEYQEAFNNPELSPALKARISDEFIINQQTHIRGLDDFIALVKK